MEGWVQAHIPEQGSIVAQEGSHGTLKGVCLGAVMQSCTTPTPDLKVTSPTRRWTARSNSVWKGAQCTQVEQCGDRDRPMQPTGEASALGASEPAQDMRESTCPCCRWDVKYGSLGNQVMMELENGKVVREGRAAERQSDPYMMLNPTPLASVANRIASPVKGENPSTRAINWRKNILPRRSMHPPDL